MTTSMAPGAGPVEATDHADVEGPRWRSPLAWLLLALLRVYRGYVSPLMGPHCRFTPSCSEYAVEAVHVHGAVRGFVLSGWRLLRCQPFHPGGFDPVPERRTRRRATSTRAGAPPC